jgi:hypothetical protein
VTFQPVLVFIEQKVESFGKAFTPTQIDTAENQSNQPQQKNV